MDDSSLQPTSAESMTVEMPRTGLVHRLGFVMAIGVAFLMLAGIFLLLWSVYAAGMYSLVTYFLDTTGALSPGNYGGSFWLAGILGVGLTVGGILLRVILDREQSPVLYFLSQPSISLFFVFLVPAMVLVIAAKLGMGVPKILIGVSSLGSLYYFWVVLPITGARLAYKLMVGLWHWGQNHAARINSTLVVIPAVSVGMLGTSGGMGWIEHQYGEGAVAWDVGSIVEKKLSMEGESLTDASREMKKDQREEIARGGREGGLGIQDSSTEIEPGVIDSATSLLDECYHELTDKNARGQIEYGESAQRRVFRALGPEDAVDLLSEKLLDVCKKYVADGGEIDDLVQYYNKAVSNALSSELQRRSKMDEVRDQLPIGVGFGGGAVRRDIVEKLRLEDCWEMLTSKEQSILWANLNLDSHEDIAEVFDIRPNTATKRISRARSSLVEHCEEYEYYH